MGLCESCCPRNNENSGQEDAYGDRSRLVGNAELGSSGQDQPEDPDATGASYDEEGRYGSVPNNGEFPFGHSKGASVPKAPMDDNQAALQEILTTMAHEVIDIGVSETTMEPSDYQERAQEYGRKLSAVAHQLAVKYDERPADGLLDSSKMSQSPEHSEVLEEAEAVLITEISARAQESATGIDFQVQNGDDLVAHFGSDCHPSDKRDSHVHKESE